MKRNSRKQGRTRKPRVRKGEPGRLEAGIRGDGISVYWETDATHGQRCCAWFDNEAFDLYLLVSLLRTDPVAPATWILGASSLMPGLLGTPRILRIDLEKRPTREEFVRVHDWLVEWQRKVFIPTEREALDLLAHESRPVREHALAQFRVWRERWTTFGPRAITPREPSIYVER